MSGGNERGRGAPAWSRPPGRLTSLLCPEEPELHADLLTHAERFILRSSLGSPTTIALVLALFWQVAPHRGLVLWAAISGVCAAIQFGVHRLYLRQRTTTRISTLVRRRAIALVVGGVSWGLLPVMVQPYDRAREYQAVLALFVVAFMAANTIFASSIRRLWLAFQLPVAITAIIGFGIHQTSMSLLLGAIVAYCVPFSAVLHQQANTAEVDSVRLAHRNAALADALREERTRIEQTNMELRHLNEQLAHQVAHDTLTDLANRHLFHDHLTDCLDAARQGAGDVAVLFLDIDRFKFVNDSLGHATGDELLVAVADRVQGCLGPHDVLARIGGDEFTVLLAGLPDHRAAYQTATTIRSVLREPFTLGHRQVRVSASIGIAFDASGHDSADDLLRHADSAMYHAKSNGRDRVEVFDDSLRASLARRIDEEHELRKAIELEQIVSWFQPEVDLHTGRIVGAESLARWVHPERGVLSAGLFVPLAEESGLVHELALCLNRDATRARASLRGVMGADMRIRLNVSAAQLMYPEQLDAFLQHLDEIELDPRLIGFEVTETAVINDLDIARRWLDQARAAGITVALDDFGTGYSSLALLSQLPLDGVKIDLSFVREMMTSTAARAVVLATVELADVLDLQVVAEGVETPEQAAALREVGVHRAQGYLWSPAVPLATLHTWLETGPPWAVSANEFGLTHPSRG
jgi:diguanylate cyclase (GGDEF)-like protein